jgi:hypothetical protein
VNDPAFRVWLGWRNDSRKEWSKFVLAMRDTFVPATWQMMRRFGLLAYVPSVLTEHQDGTLPDETALLVYESADSYKKRSDTVGGRAYSMLHEAVFRFKGTPASRSDWAEGGDGPSQGVLVATRWPAPKGGAAFAAAASRVVFIVLRHPSGAAPAPEDVRAALGSLDGELVVCRDGDLSYAWLASTYSRPAASVRQDVLRAEPAWIVEAAHDALPANCHDDVYMPLTEPLPLAADSSLHFARG